MPLAKETLLLIFTLGGISLKLADHYGEQARDYLSYFFAAAAAICMGLLISDNPYSSSIMLGIIVGVILAGKVDRLNMMIGLGLTLTTAAMLGFSLPDFPLLMVVAVASLIDETGHDRSASKGILAKFFRFRMALKTIIVLLTVLGWVDVVHALGFFCFDVSYDITDLWISGR